MCDVNDGKLDELKSLMSEMVDSTRENEPGALNYEWWLNDNDSELHLYERYADPDATLAHLESFGKNFAKRFMSVVTPKKFLVYGATDERVTQALSAMGPAFFKRLGGFVR
jgi:quinol monooxygenase YgiN